MIRRNQRSHNPEDTRPNPRHIAIIMDGNGRWAKRRHLPRVAGHKAGVNALRDIVEHALARGIGILTVYAFSSENWRRPEEEVRFLMDLFITALQEQVQDLHENGVAVGFIGDRLAFSKKLQKAIAEAETLTQANKAMRLMVAANYGGRWDIATACRTLAAAVAAGKLEVTDLDETRIGRTLSLGELPEPDLFIRTGGEQRISNYLLWQIAYTELYFTDVLWPDFSAPDLDLAIDWYKERQRRFGRTPEQLADIDSA